MLTDLLKRWSENVKPTLGLSESCPYMVLEKKQPDT
jgi:hypothetical protein